MLYLIFVQILKSNLQDADEHKLEELLLCKHEIHEWNFDDIGTMSSTSTANYNLFVPIDRIPPNVQHLQRVENGYPIPAETDKVPASEFQFFIHPFAKHILKTHKRTWFDLYDADRHNYFDVAFS